MRRDYANWMLQDGINRQLLFMDEAGFNLFTRRTRGRAQRGQRAVRQVANSRGPSLNLILALSAEGGLAYFEITTGTTTRVKMQEFFDNLSQVIGQEFEVTIVMDNAPVHNGIEFEEGHEPKRLPLIHLS